MNEKLPAAIEREIPKLNESQLRILNQKIVERLKLIHKAKALNALSKFSIGDLVSFDNYGEIVKGRIIRINQKTVSLVTLDNKQKWNIPPNFLNKEEPSKYEPEKENEIEIPETLIKIVDDIPEKKTSRNAPCPCGSGKKYKHCCGK